jgi:hypothetical protein
MRLWVAEIASAIGHWFIVQVMWLLPWLQGLRGFLGEENHIIPLSSTAMNFAD